MLHPSRRAAAAQPATSQLSDVALVLNSITGLIGVSNRQHDTPQTPTRPRTATLEVPAESSPTRPSPSQLHRYLIHAGRKLGIQDATQYESALEKERYRPDILSFVDDERLAALKIPLGEIYRLKKGSLPWFNSPDAKRKHDNIVDLNSPRAPQDPDEGGSPKKRVMFERTFGDGGKSRFDGPPMILGDPKDTDRHTMYWNEAIAAFAPIPGGYTVAIDYKGDDEPEDDDTD